MIRAPTVRSEISHKVIEGVGQNLIPSLVKFKEVLKKNDLMIIFCKTKKELFQIGEKFPTDLKAKLCYYHGELRHDERIKAAKMWSSGSNPIMMATTAFAFGIHDPKCNLVVHVGAPYSLDDYIQATGRCGRDGRDATSFVLVNESKARIESEQVKEFLFSKECRLKFLSNLYDTKKLENSCGKCDNCVKNKFKKNIIPESFVSKNISIKRLGNFTPLNEKIMASKKVALLLNSINKFEKIQTKGCFTCHVLSKLSGEKNSDMQGHNMRNCPHWKNKFFRCGGNCKRRDCKNHKIIQAKLPSANKCITCGLPPYFLAKNIHKGQGSMGKDCKFRDTILSVSTLCFQDLEKRKRIEDMCKVSFKSFEDFIEWAFVKPDRDASGLGNFVLYLFEHGL